MCVIFTPHLTNTSELPGKTRLHFFCYFCRQITHKLSTSLSGDDQCG